jgi:hypothetical protein
MTLKIQNYRSSTSGDKPPSLLEGQVAFNLADNFMYLGKGLNQNLDINGDPVLPNPPAGEGWQEYNMDVGAPGNVSSVSVSGEGLSVNQTTGAVVITSTLIKQVAGASSMSIGPSTGSPGSANGGNTFVGAFAGAAQGGSNGLNTYIGSNAGKNIVGGNQNVIVGSVASNNTISDASGTTLIGYNAGSAIGSSTNLTTIVGGHQGYAGTSGEVIIGRNSCFLRLNTDGALCIADNVATEDFGIAGQVLTSNGDADPPTWETPATFADSGSLNSGSFVTPVSFYVPANTTIMKKVAIMANDGGTKYYSWVIDLAYTTSGGSTTGFNNIATVMEEGAGTETLTPTVEVSTESVSIRLTRSDGSWNYSLTALIS